MKRIDFFINRIENELEKNHPSDDSLKSIYDDIKKECSVNPDADELYLQGYVLFHLSKRNSFENKLAIDYFQRVLVIDENANFSRYYLSFLLYDNEEYDSSLSTLEKIDLSSFETCIWRTFKVKEMIFACRILLSKDSSELDIFIRSAVLYFEEVVKNESEEIYNYPIDLIRACYKKVIDLNNSILSLELLINLMLKLELDDTYPEELATFRLNLGKNNKHL